MTARYLPADWGEMRQAIRAWAAGVMGPDATVVWTNQDPYPPGRPLVTLAVTSLPSDGTGTVDELRVRSGARVTVTDLQPDTSYSLAVAAAGGEPVTIEVTSSSEPDPLWPAFVESISADPTLGPLVSAEALSDHLRLAAVDPLADLEVTPGPRLASVPIAVEERTGDRAFTVHLEVRRSNVDRSLAEQVLAEQGAMALRDSMFATPTLAALAQAGIAVSRREQITSQPRLYGAIWEARAVFNAVFRARSRMISEVETADLQMWPISSVVVES